ncbi:sialidase family protein [Actinophytocola oryzae]|uniref:BNR repeat protein n=1 Tax=Actinophytocola oryzae TaxID=502181 RepID=A0A4R7W4C2_9PSEU|nr:sialidase family protein [Actinophytocola oryzae]TDV56477.1 BNR repeat protein [Actinophytocola oryzae]
MLGRTLLVAALVAGTAVQAPSAEAVTRSEIAGASPTAPTLVVSGEGSVYNPAGDPPTWYATAEAYDTGTAAAPTRTVFGGYVDHYDADGASDNGQLVSTDGGQTFATTTRPGYEASARLSDGRVIDAQFIGQTSVSLQRRTLVMRYSTDSGTTFPTTANATLDIAPQSFAATSSNFFPNTVVQVPNGPLLMAGYANLSGGQSALLVQSTNAGGSWTLRSVIAQGSSTRGYSETALALNSDGDLITVSRSSTYDNLWRRMSTDLGTTWTAAPQGIPEFAADSSGNRPFGRINPRLSLLPNGILALVAGRPDNSIALSYDGRGTTWNVRKVYYDNHSTASPQDLNEGSSGNADFAWTESNRAVLLADSCHAVTYQGTHYNKCKWHNAPMSGGTTEFQIMRAMADVLTADTGKIDLSSKARLSGDLGAVAGHDRSGARGAVDGSTELWSGAFEQGGTGTFDLALDRPYTLTRAGLSLALGGTQSATVQTRLDASDPWQDWYSVTNQEGYALRYTSPPARKAQYVRVLTGPASYCPPGVTAPCSMLNEIELYAGDVDSFENDPVNGIPRGYSVDYTVDDQGRGHQGVWVTTSTAGSGSGRALFITDDHAQHLPAVRRTDSSSATRTLEFRFHPVKWRPTGEGSPSSFMFDLLATPVSGQRRTAYHLSVWSDGTVRYYAGNAWHALGSGPALDPSTAVWSTIRVDATATRATVTVNGVTTGSATRADGATSNMTGHQFSASSTADANETFIIDDVFTGNG